jgi:hypothetical protein
MSISACTAWYRAALLLEFSQRPIGMSRQLHDRQYRRRAKPSDESNGKLCTALTTTSRPNRDKFRAGILISLTSRD